MEIRALVVALVAICNFAAETLEKLLAEDGGDGKASRSEKPSRSRPSRAKGKENDDDDDKDDDDNDDEPSEDDIVDAVRAAQKVLEKADITKILKKHGKAERATEVEPDMRQAVIDALEKAVDAA